MALTARRHHARDAELAEVLSLIRKAFCYMDGVVDPPSSVHNLTLDALQEQCSIGEIWSLGTPIAACMLLTPGTDALNVGKLAVAADQHGRGLARQLVNLAATRAKDLRLPALELQSRIELTKNHAIFAALGFQATDRTAHPGYPRPTSIRFRKPLKM